MKKLFILALVSATGIVAQASPNQPPAKKNGVPKSEVAAPKTMPNGKAPVAATPQKASPSTSRPNTKSPVNTLPSKPVEKK